VIVVVYVVIIMVIVVVVVTVVVLVIVIMIVCMVVIIIIAVMVVVSIVVVIGGVVGGTGLVSVWMVGVFTLEVADLFFKVRYMGLQGLYLVFHENYGIYTGPEHFSLITFRDSSYLWYNIL